MSAGKETPRQKMIGMMYLVLTCLLALNVSKEILQGFVTLNESIEHTNANFSVNSKMMLEAFEEAIEKGHHEARPYYQKAQEVTRLTQSTFSYVEGLKAEVKQYTENSPGADTMQLANIERLDDFDKPTYLLLGPDEKQLKTGPHSAKELRQKITGLTLELSKLLDEMKDKNGMKLPPEDYLLLKEKIKAFTPHDRYKDADGKPIGWEYKHFYNMPLAAVVTNLSKLQSDIRNVEAEMIGKFATAATKMAVRFDGFRACIIPQSKYVASGTPYVADVMLTATSSEFREDNIQFVLGDMDTATGKLAEGARLLPVESGNGKISLPTASPGRTKIHGWIKFRDGNGSYKYLEYRDEYVVANAAVAVSAEQMNVMYVGVDNGISVSAAGVAPTDLGVKIEGCGGTLTPKGDGKFTAHVFSTGTCSITVFEKTPGGIRQHGGVKVFRVKKIPNPPFKIAGKSTYGQLELSAATARTIGSLGVDNSGFDFNIPMKVISFTMNMYINGKMTQDYKISGPNLSQEAIAVISRAKAGSKIYFEDIKVQTPTEIRNFPMIKISVK